MAIKAYPEIRENIKDVFIMGGNIKGKEWNEWMPFTVMNTSIIQNLSWISGRGNSLKGSEFNFYKDPEAAHIVLNSLICPISIIPFESGLEESISIPLVWNQIIFPKNKWFFFIF